MRLTILLIAEVIHEKINFLNFNIINIALQTARFLIYNDRRFYVIH